MSRDYSPSVIASSFIKQYYEMMAKHPENLHKFYNEDSHFLHSDLNHANGVNGSGPDSIRAAISSLNLKNTKVDLSNGYIDAQKAANNGVVVVVVGQLSFPGGSARPFVQSFVLSNQASSAYYVSNSVFRLLVPSEEQGDINSVLVNLSPPAAAQPAAAVAAVAASAPVVEESSASTAVDASGDRLSGYIAVESLLLEAANEPDEHVPAAVVAPEPVVVEEEPVVAVAPIAAPAPAAVAPVAPVVVAAVAPAAPAAPVDPLKKLNYSEIVKKLNSAAAAAPAPAAPAAPTHRVVPTPVVTVASASTGHSVYIKQVPEAATVAELQALFSSFGPVASVEQQAGKSFAFVRFETATAMQAAVAATSGDRTLSLHGHNLRVEERNSSRPAGGAGAGGHHTGHTGSSSGAGAHGAAHKAGDHSGRGNRDRGGRDRDRDGKDRSDRGGDRDRGGGDRRAGGENKPRSGDNRGNNRGPSSSNTGSSSSNNNNTKAK